MTQTEVDPRRLTLLCHQGRHDRCEGTVLVFDGDRSDVVRCECPTCRHRGDRRKPVDPLPLPED